MMQVELAVTAAQRDARPKLGMFERPDVPQALQGQTWALACCRHCNALFAIDPEDYPLRRIESCPPLPPFMGPYR
jgi:hypothetical protein